MNIEELVQSIKQPTTHYADQDFIDTDIERIIKEYADWYAKQMCESQREVCADELSKHNKQLYPLESYFYSIIINAPLPIFLQ